MQYTTTLISLFALTSAVIASPLSTRNGQGNDQPSFVNIAVQTSAGTDSNKTSIELTANLNQLTSCKDGDDLCSTSQLSLSPGAAGAMRTGSVECRGYKDEAGTQPGSAAFNLSTPADISTNLDTIGSVLCYLISSS